MAARKLPGASRMAAKKPSISKQTKGKAGRSGIDRAPKPMVPPSSRKPAVTASAKEGTKSFAELQRALNALKHHSTAQARTVGVAAEVGARVSASRSFGKALDRVFRAAGAHAAIMGYPKSEEKEPDPDPEEDMLTQSALTKAPLRASAAIPASSHLPGEPDHLDIDDPEEDMEEDMGEEIA